MLFLSFGIRITIPFIRRYYKETNEYFFNSERYKYHVMISRVSGWCFILVCLVSNFMRSFDEMTYIYSISSIPIIRYLLTIWIQSSMLVRIEINPEMREKYDACIATLISLQSIRVNTTLNRINYRIFMNNTYTIPNVPITDSHKECSVCLERFEDDNEIVLLNCRHIFHSQCIITWIGQHLTCPICRGRIEIDMQNGNLITNHNGNNYVGLNVEEV